MRMGTSIAIIALLFLILAASALQFMLHGF
jgi:hypothetical protein